MLWPRLPSISRLLTTEILLTAVRLFESAGYLWLRPRWAQASQAFSFLILGRTTSVCRRDCWAVWWGRAACRSYRPRWPFSVWWWDVRVVWPPTSLVRWDWHPPRRHAPADCRCWPSGWQCRWCHSQDWAFWFWPPRSCRSESCGWVGTRPRRRPWRWTIRCCHSRSPHSDRLCERKLSWARCYCCRSGRQWNRTSFE